MQNKLPIKKYELAAQWLNMQLRLNPTIETKNRKLSPLKKDIKQAVKLLRDYEIKQLPESVLEVLQDMGLVVDDNIHVDVEGITKLLTESIMQLICNEWELHWKEKRKLESNINDTILNLIWEKLI
jgi:hypothetical protein